MALSRVMLMLTLSLAIAALSSGQAPSLPPTTAVAPLPTVATTPPPMMSEPPPTVPTPPMTSSPPTASPPMTMTPTVSRGPSMTSPPSPLAPRIPPAIGPMGPSPSIGEPRLTPTPGSGAFVHGSGDVNIVWRSCSAPCLECWTGF